MMASLSINARILRMESRVLQTEWHKEKRLAIAVHVFVWLLIFLLPYILDPSFETGAIRENKPKPDFRTLNTLTNLVWVALFYVNALVLTPQLIYKRKFVLYAVSLFGLFCLSMMVHALLFSKMLPDFPFRFSRSAAHNILPFLFTITGSIAYKMISDKIKSDKLLTEKNNENLKTELSFLRSQISPHFLFNIMNNIVAMVRLKSNDLEPTVMKLSSLMHYMLYETDEEKVLLKSEIEYLHNYIDLQKMRFGTELKLDVLFTIQEDWHAIEPMLLIPFVENAFKHGSGLLHQPEIAVEVMVKNSHLHFSVKNRYEDSEAIKDKTSGIGLTNVKRRLELLYPGRHVLSIDKSDAWFTVYLQLTLR